MKDIYTYIEMYDELMSTIEEYKSKKHENQIIDISITKNEEKAIVDIGLIDLTNDCKDIRTKILSEGFDEYVLPRIILRYNNWYQTRDESLVKLDNDCANYANVSSIGDRLSLLNYPMGTIQYIRHLID